jgi:hypothetical protein
VVEGRTDWERLLRAAGGVGYLIGYWQSERYFLGIRDVLGAELEVQEAPTGANLRLLERIRSCDAVSLHVRRGDYVADPRTNAFHGILDQTYYQDALRVVGDQVGNPTVFVFSDDIEAARAYVGHLGLMTFVDVNGPAEAHQDLRLMRACKHHIIANSSLSWWGAWLADWPHKVVIAPRRWFKDPNAQGRSEELIPRNWQRL